MLVSMLPHVVAFVLLQIFCCRCLADSVVSLMPLTMPVLIVSSALRQYVRKERLMEDAEFGLMLAAALDAIHASEDEWSSRLLHNGKILALDNDGAFEWTLAWDSPKAKKRRLLM